MPVLPVILLICFILTGAIGGIQTLFGKHIPDALLPAYLSGNQSEEKQYVARFQAQTTGCFALFMAMLLTGLSLCSLNAGSAHEALTTKWCGLSINHTLGATGLMLGIGMIRLAFAKPLPAVLTPYFLRRYFSPSSEEEIIRPTLRAALLVIGLLFAEAGALLYYSIGADK